MAIISLIFFVAIIAIAFKSKLNAGLLGFTFALILGRVTGVADKAVIGYFGSSMFVQLVGIMLLFGAIMQTGAIEWLSKKAVSLVGKRVWLMPIVLFVIGFVLAVVGPGGLSVTTPLLLLAIACSTACGYSPIMLCIIGNLGVAAGRISPITPEGTLLGELAAAQGLTEGVFGPVMFFMIASCVLYSFVIFFVYGGHKVRYSDIAHVANEEKVEKLTRNQMVGLLAIAVMLILVVAFSFNAGLVAYAFATLLFLFKIADQNSTIKALPWNTIVMVGGMGLYVTAMKNAGGLDLITNTLSSLMTPITAPSLTAAIAGIMSLVSSAFGVVFPTMYPMATELAAGAGYAYPVALLAAVTLGASLAGYSPLSTTGAWILGMTDTTLHLSDNEQQKTFIKLLIVGLFGIVYTAIAALLFGTLSCTLFG